MQQLKTERIHLGVYSMSSGILNWPADLSRNIEYEWTPLWRAILSLASFVVARIDDLRQQSTAIELLISQVRSALIAVRLLADSGPHLPWL